MARIRYRLSSPEPHTHLLEVEVRLPRSGEATDLVMPSWTPGSYLLREFPRNVQAFSAATAGGDPLRWEKVDKNRWRVRTAGTDAEIVARYTVYANELTVRTSHVDDTHAYVNGASVFMAAAGREREPVELEIDTPDGWRVTTPLSRSGGDGAFRAGSFHELVDSPIEIGTHRVLEFEAEGKPHRYAIWGRGSVDEERLLRDTRAVIRAAAAMWGGLPYEDYTFFLHLLPGSRGGLEHRASCSLHADRFGFAGVEYEQFIALVAHEFFHTWNGTRIRPEPLVEPDYTRENYTRNLWVVEGLTTYYTDLLLVRAGLITPRRYLDRLGEAISRHQNLPGRHVQTLADSSFDTWIKFYRPDEHTPNAQVSYYQKGALVGLLLDMRIREETAGMRSLDDVMRTLWQRYGEHDRGYPEAMEEGIRAVAEEVAGVSLEAFFDGYVFGLDDLDFDAAFRTVGLCLTRDPPGAGVASPPPGAAPAEPAAVAGAGAAGDALLALGIRLEEARPRPTVAYVRAGSAAHRAGINARDEIVGLDGFTVDAAALRARVGAAAAGSEMVLTVLRRGELRTVAVAARPNAPVRARLVPRSDETPAQAAERGRWLAGSGSIAQVVDGTAAGT